MRFWALELACQHGSTNVRCVFVSRICMPKTFKLLYFLRSRRSYGQTGMAIDPVTYFSTNLVYPFTKDTRHYSSVFAFTLRVTGIIIKIHFPKMLFIVLYWVCQISIGIIVSHQKHFSHAHKPPKTATSFRKFLQFFFFICIIINFSAINIDMTAFFLRSSTS